MTRILKHIVFVAVIAVALLFSAGASPTVMAVAMAAVAAAAAIGIAAVRHERQKYATLLKAIRNNDFTMRFQKGDKEINALLDSLTEIIKLSKSGAELRERYYKAIIDRVNAGIIAIDSNGNVRICNDNALKMLGMKYAANTAAINRSLPGFDNIIADSTVAGTTIVGCGKDKNLSVSVSGFVHDGNTTTVCVLTDIHNALSHKEVDAWGAYARDYEQYRSYQRPERQPAADGIRHNERKNRGNPRHFSIADGIHRDFPQILCHPKAATTIGLRCGSHIRGYDSALRVNSECFGENTYGK